MCPVVVGRERELAALDAHLRLAAAGQGRLVALVGEAGVGKSRLATAVTAAAENGAQLVLAGRAVPSAAPTAYRPLTEAFLGASRAGQRPEAPELDGFHGQIARLVPGWGTFESGGPDESPLLVAEAVVRLLRVLAADHGCVLLLEDLHWADPETLAVVDYLADTIGAERVLTLVTTRPDTPAVDDLLSRIRTRAGTEILRPAPLTDAQQALMVTACLDSAKLPRDLAQFIRLHSDGVPFLIEELLAGVVAAGALRRGEDGWQTLGPLTPAVPASLTDSVRSRLAQLGPPARQVLGAAAVFGRRFDWSLLPGVAGTDGAGAVEVLRAALAEQLITVNGQEFRFRHALTREAVLAELLPPERVALSRRALDAVRLAHPGLPGAWCELAAELAEGGGEFTQAAELLADSARRALARGALGTARSAAERAVAQPTVASSEGAEVLLQVLVQAGDALRASEVGAQLVDVLRRTAADPRRIVAAQMLLIRAAIANGDTAAAERLLAEARRVVVEDRDAVEITTRLDALGAHVALDAERLDLALQLATKAVDHAAAAGLADAQCEALEALGRIRRLDSAAAGIALFERAVRVAERHNLASWRLRALQELTMLRASVEGPEPLRQLRTVAANAGALILVAHIDLILAEMSLGNLRADECAAAATRCLDASRRYGLASLPVALLWLAGAHALRGAAAEMEAVLAEASAIDPDDQRIRADSWGRVRAIYHAVREERAALRAALDTAAELARSAPQTRSLFLGRTLWAVLHALDDADLGAAARAELAAAPITSFAGGRAAVLVAEAIAAGREGDADRAVARFDEARALIRGGSIGLFFGGLIERFAAEAAVRDGWGNPATWLRELEAYYDSGGYERLARACRALLVEAGAPAPRRGRGDSLVPPHLRALGVTSRELDVLKLVAEGLSNREIGERLFLSIRTVDNHVASLLRRTGARNRGALAATALTA